MAKKKKRKYIGIKAAAQGVKAAEAAKQKTPKGMKGPRNQKAAGQNKNPQGGMY